MPIKMETYPLAQVLEGMKKAVTLTRSLSEDELTLLAELAGIEQYQKGEMMIVEEAAENDIFVIAEGQVAVELKLTASDDNGARILKLGEGSVIGEVAFVDGQRRSASIRMVSPTIVYHFPAGQVKALCDRNTALGYKFMSNLALIMAHRIRNANIELRTYLCD